MGRRFVRISTLAALVAASMPWVSSASYAIQIPETLHSVVRLPKVLGKDGVVEKVLPFAATDLGVVWKGEEGEPEVRSSRDGDQWSRWRQIHEFEDMFDETSGTHYSELIDGHDARRVQVRLRSADEFGREISEGAVRLLSVSVINTEDGPLRRIPLIKAALGATAQPGIISRAAWGADESLRRGSPSFARVKKIFVHHTVTPNNDSNPAATLRAMLAYHVRTRGWDDIGYNMVIDSAGRTYEGRYSRSYGPGETPTTEDPNGMGVVGAHTADFNTGTTGVALLGNSERAAPTAPAMSALVDVLAWEADRHGINPLASDPYQNSASGAKGAFPNISGHRDSPSAATSCPGRGLYTRLPSVRQQVESKIASSSGVTAPSMPTGTQMIPGGATDDPTPGAVGDVSRSTVRVDVTFTGQAPLSSRVVSATPSGGSFSLTDASYGGLALPSDTYTITAVAFDAQGRASPPAPVTTGYKVSGGPASLLGILPILGPILAPAAGAASAPGNPSADPLATITGAVTGLTNGLGLGR